jgi:prolyl-tRNA synthetase
MHGCCFLRNTVNIYNRALKFRTENTYYVDKWSEFLEILDNQGGFIMAHWDGTPETEEKIKDEIMSINANVMKTADMGRVKKIKKLPFERRSD